LRKYTEHVEKHGRNTFLPQIYGCYSIKIGKGRGTYKTFLVIGYWFATQVKVGSPRYDLKGSRCKRTAKEDPTKEVELLKDNNFVAHEERDCVRTLRRKTILESLKRDADFLSSLGLIDYSLLLGHHNMRSDSDLPSLTNVSKKKTFVKSASMFGRVEKGEKDSEKHVTTRMKTTTPRTLPSLSSSGNEPALVGDEQRVNQLRFARTPTGVAFFGIVDVLAEWTTFKWFEWFFKSALFCGKRDVSCQPPKKYAERFKKFMEEHVIKERE
jgi:1-phosphatidylinositol-4-phosphate 5-kinase